jgi:hypothetical protein
VISLFRNASPSNQSARDKSERESGEVERTPLRIPVSGESRASIELYGGGSYLSGVVCEVN